MTTEAQDQVTERAVTTLPLERVMPAPGMNPRTFFDQGKLQELADSIEENGLHQPVLAFPRPDDYPDHLLNGKSIPDQVTHLIYAGERRWRGVTMAELEEIPVIVRDIGWQEALGIALVENLQREDLTPVEEARGLQRYMEANEKMTQTEVGESLGYSQSWVANRLRLLKLPDEILDHIQEGALNATTARDLLLPWAQLREDLRETWWGKLTASLNRTIGNFEEDELPLSDGKVREVLQRVGVRLSKPTKASHVYSVDDDRPHLTAEQHHERCDCNAPAFKWATNMYASKTVRCFDPERWEELEAEAQEAWEKKQAAREEEKEEAGFDTPEERLEALGVEDRGEVIPWDQLKGELGGAYQNQWTTLWNGRREKLCKLFDPRELDPDTVLRVEGTHYMADEVPDDLICVDPEAVERAQAAASEELQDEYARRRRERGERDAEEVGWGAPDAKGLARIMATRFPPTSTLLNILGDLELFDEEDVENQTLEDVLSELAAKDVFQVAKILELRIRRGEVMDAYHHHDPLLDETRSDLQEDYAEALRKIAPRAELPSPADLVEEEDDEESGDVPALPNPKSKTMSAEVWGMVAQRLQEKPDVSVDELYSRAKGIDSDIGDLTLRQFNARYVLQVKKAIANR